MNRLIAFALCVLVSSPAFSHVCNNIRVIQGFSSSHLFQNAIINNKPLDYYTFSSECNIDCLKAKLKNKNISYSLNRNVLSVFDKASVATLTFESIGNQVISGYLTCSSTDNRQYITHPLHLFMNKASLDLQTEDYKTISRTINLQGYTKSEYARLVSQLNKIAISKKNIVGFTDYKISTPKFKQSIKISKLSYRGDFMINIEVNK
ncbi:hypothetical protein [Psychrobacter lutiphocae]|uniref:hypothetical protein n=1 Tax=Psychrobacter lutiphocae TaxID=540500 RepID=UPI00037479C1|nr:hypothetical protein [Psychrobacter lutiphocae]